jgi:hypothetical protein
MGVYKMRYIFQLLFITAFLLIAGEGYSSEEESGGGQEMSFKWAIILANPKGERGTLSITKNTTVFSGDSLSIFIRPIERAYVYLYLVDSNDDLSLLFPARISDFDKDYSLAEEYRIPELKLDYHKGTETFFLLASVKRLEKLESLTKVHMSALDRAREEKDNPSRLVQEAAKSKVIDEITNIQVEVRKAMTDPVETPTPILGTMRTRGVKEETEISSYAIEVSAKNIYSKTIKLEHK